MGLKKSKLILTVVTLFTLSSCGMFSKRATEQPRKPTTTTQEQKDAEIKSAALVSQTPEPTSILPETATHEEGVRSEDKSAPDAINQDSAKPTAKKHGEFSKPDVSGETSLRWLKNGNTRFVKKSYRADGRSEKDRARLVKGQHPHAIVLSCSDSRVPPEIVFDQALGEIFVIRVIGEALDSTVIASIEYGFEHLHIGLLVVMGHSQCGAIQATVKTPEGTSTGSADIDKVLSDIRPRLATIKNEPNSSNLEVESILNADGVARDLVNRSTILKSAVESGHFLIRPALYRVDTGKVSFY